VACTLTTPLDVAKTRVMTQNPSNPMIYLGLQATLQKIWLEEVSGLGTGMRDPLDYSFDVHSFAGLPFGSLCVRFLHHLILQLLEIRERCLQV
jgi:hypothetical protein